MITFVKKNKLGIQTICTSKNSLGTSLINNKDNNNISKNDKRL